MLAFFGLTFDEFTTALITPEAGVQQVPTPGKIVVLNEDANGSLNDMPTANVGYWLDKYGNVVNWGNGHAVYYEMSGTAIQLGKLGAEAGIAGETITMRPVFVYTDATVSGATKTLKFVINYQFK